MKRITSQTVKEEYFTKTLDNGLKVYLIPKPKFHRTYALFATRFGSIDIEFIPDGFSEYLKVPEGIAHFLEHKTFETKDGIDATDLFAKYGADSNAYTTYDKVVFLFSCTSHIKENLNILLDFVQNPHFTKDSVLKEQGMEMAYLTTDDWRIPAIKSYLRIGFEPDLSNDDFKTRWTKILTDLNKI